MSAELRILIEAKAARIHRLAASDERIGIDRLSIETAELQAMIAEAAREERLQQLSKLEPQFAQA